MRWLDSITDSMDINLSKFQETKKGSLVCCSPWGCTEELIPADRLGAFSAGFISGTSPKVLPIARVGENVTYDVNDPVLRRMIDLYDEEIRRYLSAE